MSGGGVAAHGDPLAALRGRHVLLGVAGGIAAYKAAEVARGLLTAGATVQAILTPGATRFLGPATLAGLTGRPAPSDVFADAHRVSHVRYAREAEVAVVAPATANVLAKFATGLADDLLSSTFVCRSCPGEVAPALRTELGVLRATQDNVATLRRRGALVVGPVEGQLAGGDEGPGRLADPAAIVAAVAAALPGPVAGSLVGRRVVVTAGGTREPLDPVRFLGNRSSGKMGHAVAAAAARRGATVDLVTAAHLPPLPGVRVHPVETALQMRTAVRDAAAAADVVVGAAAVADFRPADYSAHKVKKADAPSALRLERNPDILAELGADKGDRVLVGFAAETEDEEAHGRDKLRRKNLDLVVVNRVDRPGEGFAWDTNAAVLLGRDGSRTEVALTSKAALAEVVCDRVERLLAARGVAEPTHRTGRVSPPVREGLLPHEPSLAVHL